MVNLVTMLFSHGIQLHNNMTTDVIFIDFKKAFDSVFHPEFISKLVSYGIRGDLLHWLKAFLTNRKNTGS